MQGVQRLRNPEERAAAWGRVAKYPKDCVVLALLGPEQPGVLKDFPKCDPPAVSPVLWLGSRSICVVV